MSGLVVDFSLDLPGFRLSVAERFASHGLTVVFGPSGSGKSSLLRVIAGLEGGAEGSVCFNGQTWQGPGRHVAPHRRAIGYVFQEARLFAHLSVAGNLAYAERRARKAGRVPDRAAIVAALGLDGLLTRRPSGLSGGEAQRVAMARALMSAPRLLLMDEPLSALDDAAKGAILPYIEAIRDGMRVPVIYVTHSVSEVARLAHHIVMLEAGQVRRAGPAQDILSDPAAAPAFGIRAAGSVLRAEVLAHHDDGLSELAVAGGRLLVPGFAAAIGTRVRVRIAAQDVILSRQRPEGLSALNLLEGELTDVRQGQGPGVMVRLRMGPEQDVLARITQRSARALSLTPGQRCFAVIKSLSIAPLDVGGSGSD
ncbi:molybdenum ABC transporter ATP-binding protein [Roseovarius sp.]|uniref:molybdenum ABC transporter ATP-binding protein n=1 Tax=Roseovarius sp. TaxID=1486281 RepID=UPI0026196B27|nr:molybdenum ABC transporter ATP-binding protein [Roseovarius sp.]